METEGGPSGCHPRRMIFEGASAVEARVDREDTRIDGLEFAEAVQQLAKTADIPIVELARLIGPVGREEANLMIRGAVVHLVRGVEAMKPHRAPSKPALHFRYDLIIMEVSEAHAAFSRTGADT